MDALDLLAQDNYIIVNKTLIKEIGLENTIVLGALCGYQRGYGVDEFYKEQENMIEDTGLTEYSIRKAIKELADMEYIFVNKRGMPAKYYYKVNLLKFKIQSSRCCENDTSSGADFDTTDNIYNNNINNKNNNKNDIIKENIKENHNFNDIFEYWNTKKIIVHRKPTVDMKNSYKKIIKNYNLSDEEIKLAIDHYEQALHSDYEYCDYEWSLYQFLSNKKGIMEFLNDGSKWVNYCKYKSKPKTVMQVNGLPAEELPDGYMFNDNNF